MGGGELWRPVLKNRCSITHVILTVFFIFFCSGCITERADGEEIPIKAVYFVQGIGQLDPADLESHPEVIVTDKFDEFKEFAKSKVSLWIDINSIDLVDLKWLGEDPQKYYPVVVVGNSKDECMFFGSLQYFPFEVPPPENGNDCKDPSPGFSVNILKADLSGNMQGFNKTPTVQTLLDVSNPLLETVK